MLTRLERTPGAMFRLLLEYRAAVSQLSAAAFAVPSAPLPTRLRGRTQLTSAVLAQLASHQLDYDAFTADAEPAAPRPGPADALKALSSLVEENPGDAVLARDVGISAMDMGPAPAGVPPVPPRRRAAPVRAADLPRHGAGPRRGGQDRPGDCLLRDPARRRVRGRAVRRVSARSWRSSTCELLRRIANGDATTRMPDYAARRLADLSARGQHAPRATSW